MTGWIFVLLLQRHNKQKFTVCHKLSATPAIFKLFKIQMSFCGCDIWIDVAPLVPYIRVESRSAHPGYLGLGHILSRSSGSDLSYHIKYPNTLQHIIWLSDTPLITWFYAYFYRKPITKSPQIRPMVCTFSNCHILITPLNMLTVLLEHISLLRQMLKTCFATKAMPIHNIHGKCHV